MTAKFPKMLYVKIVKDGDTEYFQADNDMYGLAEMGESTKVASYSLVETADVDVILNVGPPKRARK